MTTATGASVPTLFHFPEYPHPIREITDAKGEPWFVAKDVCNILGLENVTKAVAKIPKRHLTLIRFRSGGQEREMNAVDESGLYRLILRSDKPQAEPLMEFVTAEVLPAIRKTGSYSMPKRPMPATHHDLEFLREGEALVRELRLGTNIAKSLVRELRLGTNIAKSLGLNGSKKLKRANEIVFDRTGIDCLDYFNISEAELIEQDQDQQQPGSTVDSVIKRFFLDYCLLKIEAVTIKREIFKAYIKFCVEDAAAPLGCSQFFQQLRKIAPELKNMRPRINNKREYSLAGIALKEESSLEVSQ